MTPEAIAEVLKPYIGVPVKWTPGAPTAAPDWTPIYTQLASYLKLIMKWNDRINLTSIRNPEEIVKRHFGESLFMGAHLGACPTLLDFGSGGGFPGVPIQLMRPDVDVTLAESRSKKAAFLHEVVRVMRLPSAVWPFRVEEMPSMRNFHTVALRAVDDMDSAVREAGRRATSRVMILGTSRQLIYSGLSEGFRMAKPVPLPESDDGVLLIATRR